MENTLSLNQLILLNETLVEKLLDLFTDDFQLKKDYKNIEDLKLQLRKSILKENLKLTFINSTNKNLESVTGQFLPNPYEIIITFPKDLNFSAFDVLSVFFHEYSHYIAENKLPGILNSSRNQSGTDGKHIKPPGTFKNLQFLKDSLPMILLLESTIQPQERSSVAFSIAYDMCNDNQIDLTPKIHRFNNLVFVDKDLVDKLRRSHEFFWKENYNNEHQIEQYLKRIPSTGSQLFFYLVGYFEELKRRNDPEFQDVLPLTTERFIKLIELIELIRKFYRRLVGIMKYAKQNKRKSSIFRI